MKIIATLIYILLQILFIPLALMGVILISFKQIYISKRLGVSGTAIEVINGRWSMHQFGMVKDDAANKLIKKLPNASVAGNWSTQFPLWIRYKLTGENWLYPKLYEDGYESIGAIITKRSLYINNIIEKHKKTTKQFIILGAGYDTRCYGLMHVPEIKCFEVDQKKTQELKIKSLRKAGIDATHVTFIDVDFSKESWSEKLLNNGYNPKLKTIFLWEGVTLYLQEKDIHKTLGELKKHTSSDSILIADWYADEFVSGEIVPGGKFFKAILKTTNEELGFSIDLKKENAALVDLLQSENLTLLNSYPLGHKTKKGAYMTVTEIQL